MAGKPQGQHCLPGCYRGCHPSGFRWDAPEPGLYDANTGEATDEDKELPSTVTFLVLPEQAKVLAELEQDAKLHLSLVYRGTADGAKQFVDAQDALIEELYAKPEEDAAADNVSEPDATTPESGVTE